MGKTNYDFDVAKISLGFESLEQARFWQSRTISVLRGETVYDSTKLARNLAENLNGKKYESGASRIYMRHVRRWYVSEVRNCLSENVSSLHVVLVPSDAEYQVRSGKLHTLNIERLKAIVTKRLERALKTSGLERAVIIGGLDLSFNEETESSGWRWPAFWQPHWSFVVQGCGRKELKDALQPAFPSSRKVPRPVRIEAIKETPEDYANVISYGLKAVFFRRVSYQGVRSKSKPHQKCFKTRNCSLKSREQRELTLFLDRLPVMQRLFLRRVRRHGKELIRL